MRVLSFLESNMTQQNWWPLATKECFGWALIFLGVACVAGGFEQVNTATYAHNDSYRYSNDSAASIAKRIDADKERALHERLFPRWVAVIIMVSGIPMIILGGITAQEGYYRRYK